MSETRRLVFRDDDAAGYELRILQAGDGDFHVSLYPHMPDFKGCDDEHAEHCLCSLASVRIRVPMIGGGAHDALWHALANLFSATTPTRAEAPRP